MTAMTTSVNGSNTTSMLLEPYRLHDLELANRIVMAPMTRARAGLDRIPNELMAEYYAQRASAGLIITEATAISEEGYGWPQAPGVYNEAMARGWKKTTDAVHAAGGKIFLQLWHMGRAGHSSFHDGQLPVAPSAIAINGDGVHTLTGKLPHETPRALETDEIPRIVEDYRKAAQFSKDAGFDGVEIHGANGYLIDEFLQSKTNQRTDRYGGSIEKRYQFLKEIVEAVTTAFPAQRVGVRLSPNGVYNDMGSPDYREQFLYVASQLNQYGLAYLHVMDGLGFGFHGQGEPMTLSEFRNVFHGPLMGNCGYDQKQGEAMLQSGTADLIAYGRPFISNPDFVNRIRHGYPLTEMAPVSVWYTPGPEGYTTFSTYGG